MLFGDSVQATEHNGKDPVDVLLDEAENVLIVPEVQGSLCDLRGHEAEKTAVRKSCLSTGPVNDRL